MAKRKTSRRRRSRRPARRRTTRRNRRRSSRRRTTKRRTRRNSRRTKVYLYYRTPGGQKKLRSLGPGRAGRALAAYKNWKSRVRGKGYRTLKMVEATSKANARSKLGLKPKRRRRSSRRR